MAHPPLCFAQTAMPSLITRPAATRSARLKSGTAAHVHHQPTGGLGRHSGDTLATPPACLVALAYRATRLALAHPFCEKGSRRVPSSHFIPIAMPPQLCETLDGFPPLGSYFQAVQV